MAWEWLSVTGTAAVGLAGIAATWLTAKGARDTQLESIKREHREQRLRLISERRVTLYAETLGMMSQHVAVTRATAIEREEVARAVADLLGSIPDDVTSSVVEHRSASVDRPNIVKLQDLKRLFELVAEIHLLAGAEVVAATDSAMSALLRFTADAYSAVPDMQSVSQAVQHLELAMMVELRITPFDRITLAELMAEYRRDNGMPTGPLGMGEADE